MILHPRSGSESVDRRLEKLHDPDFAEQLRKTNPRHFSPRTSRLRLPYDILAVVGMIALIAGYLIETIVTAPHAVRAVATPNRVHHGVRVGTLRYGTPHHATAPAPVRIPATTPVVHRAIVAEPLHVRVLQPQETAQARARASAIAQANAQARAQAEARMWLRAEAQARAQDRARAATAAAVAAAQAPRAPPAATGPVSINNGPNVPAPTGNTPPSVRVGGCHRHGISLGGHGIGSTLLNFVLQNVVRIPGIRP